MLITSRNNSQEAFPATKHVVHTICETKKSDSAEDMTAEVVTQLQARKEMVANV